MAQKIVTNSSDPQVLVGALGVKVETQGLQMLLHDHSRHLLGRYVSQIVVSVDLAHANGFCRRGLIGSTGTGHLYVWYDPAPVYAPCHQSQPLLP